MTSENIYPFDNISLLRFSFFFKKKSSLQSRKQMPSSHNFHHISLLNIVRCQMQIWEILMLSANIEISGAVCPETFQNERNFKTK